MNEVNSFLTSLSYSFGQQKIWRTNEGVEITHLTPLLFFWCSFIIWLLKEKGRELFSPEDVYWKRVMTIRRLSIRQFVKPFKSEAFESVKSRLDINDINWNGYFLLLQPNWCAVLHGAMHTHEGISLNFLCTLKVKQQLIAHIVHIILLISL